MQQQRVFFLLLRSNFRVTFSWHLFDNSAVTVKKWLEEYYQKVFMIAEE